MKKEAYLNGAYPVGPSKYKMGLKKYGPIPTSEPVVAAPKPPVVEEKPKEKPKAVKKKKTEE